MCIMAVFVMATAQCTRLNIRFLIFVHYILVILLNEHKVPQKTFTENVSKHNLTIMS